MSHCIEIREVDGKSQASYVENGKEEVAWHRLGQRYDHPLTAAEAIKGCHADYEVRKQPLLAVPPELMRSIKYGDLIAASELRKYIYDTKMATMRMDTLEPLGIVSDIYGIVQNAHAFDFIDLLTTGKKKSQKPVIECAGVLGHGERIFITAKFPEPIIVRNSNNDVIDMYIVFTTSHDGTGAVTCMVTPVRVVCNNTLNYAMKHNSGKMIWRHTSNVLDEMDLTKAANAKKAYQALHLYDVYCKEFERSLDRLAKRRIKDEDIRRILGAALLSKEEFTTYKKARYDMECLGIANASRNLLYNAMQSLFVGVGQNELEAGTGLWLMNGVTTYFQNARCYRSDESKMNSLFGGQAHQAMQSTYRMLSDGS